MKNYIKYIFIIFVASNIYSQNLIIKNKINNEKILYDKLNEISMSTKKLESLIFSLDSLQPIIDKQKNDTLSGLTYRVKYTIYSDLLNNNLALSNIEKSIFFYNKAKHFKGVTLSTMNKGNFYLKIGDNKKALENYILALNIAEKNKLYFQTGLLNRNIGVVFSNQENHKKAIIYANKSLNIFLKLNKKKQIAECYLNIGNCYFNEYDSKNATLYYKKAEELFLNLKDERNLVIIYDNLAMVMIEDKKDTINGINYLEKSISLKKSQNDQNGLIFTYNSIAQINISLKKFFIAEKYLKSAEIMALKSENKNEIAEIYKNYSKLYESKKDFKNALIYHKKYKILKDTILNIGNLKSTKELETKYQTTKKEKQIIAQQAQAKQKNIYLIGLSVLGFLIGLIGFLIYKQQKQKNQQQAQENDLKLAIEKIENQNKLQEQRLSISRDLHDNIGSQLTFIISSVDNVKYGFDITNEKLDNKLTNISSFAKDTILELRDTIWAMNSNEINYEDLEIRINNFIEKAKLSQENISFSFAIDQKLKTQKLTSVEGMNVYRTIQEAINNSLKYAQADIISVNIKPQNNQVAINIKDNGKGFDLETIEKGNGLNNMKKRIEEIGGKFDLSSSNYGTKIEILINS